MFKSWFTRDTAPETLPEADEKLALGTLLVRMAKVDDEYHVAEITTVDRALAQNFGLSAVEAAKMRATCEKLEKAAPDTEEYVSLLRENIPEYDRRALLDTLHDVALSDGVEHPSEDRLLRELGPALLPEGR